MPTMETINQNTEDGYPCMGALTFKILTNLWQSQTQDESCQCVSLKIKEVLVKYPAGGAQCIEEIAQLASKNKKTCPLQEKEKWNLVYDLANKRISQ